MARRFSGLGRYARLVRVPGVAPVGLASVVARLPLGMLTIALLLLTQDATGSFQRAGLAVGVFALTSALGSPVRGRLADRFGPVPVLLATAVGQTAALVAVALVAPLACTQPAPLLVAVAAAGLLMPPVGPVVRTVWPRLVTDAELAPAVFALDALVLQLLYYVAGPTLAAALATGLGPRAGVLGVAALTLGGGVAVAVSAPVRDLPRRAGRTHRLGPLREPRLLAVLLVVVVSAAAASALDVSVTAYAVDRHAAGWVGVLLAMVGVGSIAGGLAHGARTPAVPLAVQYGRWLLVLAGSCSLMIIAPGVGVLAAVLVLVGIPVAPVSTCQFSLVGEIAPPGTLTEAFTWLFSATLAGTAVGSIIAGTVAEHLGPRASLLTPAALALLAAALTPLISLRRPSPRPVR